VIGSKFYNLRLWWFKIKMRRIIKQSRFNLDRDYQKYMAEAQKIGIPALSFPDWCGIGSIRINLDYNEVAHHVAIGLYPICACGDWMYQHDNMTGKCSVCRPNHPAENCQEFRLSHYGKPFDGYEKAVAVAFIQAIYECD